MKGELSPFGCHMEKGHREATVMTRSPEKLEYLQTGRVGNLGQVKSTEVVGSGQTQDVFCKHREQHDLLMV